jgi:hypothetical protein
MQTGESPAHGFPGNGNVSPEKNELEKLRRDLARVKEEREIPKRPWPSFHDGRDPIPLHRRVRLRASDQIDARGPGSLPERILRIPQARPESQRSGQ